MKKLLTILLLATSAIAYGQGPTTLTALNLVFDINTSNSFSSPFTVSGTVQHSTTEYNGNDVQVGDFVYYQDGTTTYVLPISTIVSQSYSTLEVELTDVSATVTYIPTGRAAVVRASDPNLLPVPPDGIAQDLATGIMNDLRLRIQDAVTEAEEITDYIGISGVAPAVAASSYPGATWRNSVGELYKSDGVSWTPVGKNYTEGFGINILTGDVIEVDTTLLATQYDLTQIPTGVDTFNVQGGNIQLSLENDGVPAYTIPVTSVAPIQAITAGTGISTSGTNNVTITNTAPDQTVVITGATGTYPNFTLPDASATNEIQTLSFASPNLSLSSGGGTVSLSPLLSGYVSGSGTSPKMAYWTGANTIGSQANMHIDNANSRLGIRTSSPGASIHVLGQDATTANFTAIFENSSSNGALKVRNDGKIAMRSASYNAYLNLEFDGGPGWGNKVIEFTNGGGWSERWIKTWNNTTFAKRGIAFGGKNVAAADVDTVLVIQAYASPRVAVNKNPMAGSGLNYSFEVGSGNDVDGIVISRADNANNLAMFNVNTDGDGILRSKSGYWTMGDIDVNLASQNPNSILHLFGPAGATEDNIFTIEKNGGYGATGFYQWYSGGNIGFKIRRFYGPTLYKPWISTLSDNAATIFYTGINNESPTAPLHVKQNGGSPSALILGEHSFTGQAQNIKGVNGTITFGSALNNVSAVVGVQGDVTMNNVANTNLNSNGVVGLLTASNSGTYNNSNSLGYSAGYFGLTHTAGTVPSSRNFGAVLAEVTTSGGTAGDLHIFKGYSTINSSVTNNYGMELKTPAGTGTITTDYGLRIGPRRGTSKWGIYVDADPVLFGFYPNTLNSSGTPVNVLSTSVSGEIQSHPISEVISGAGGITGTGTTNYLPKWTGSTTLGNSLLFDNGTSVGINDATPSQTLDVGGTMRLAGSDGTPINIMGRDADGNIANFTGMTTGQVLQWSGSAWVPATVSASTNLAVTNATSPLILTSDTGTDVTITAGSGISLAGTSSSITITNTGDTDASNDLTTSTAFSGDVSGTYNSLALGNNTVTNSKIVTGTIDVSKIAASGASTGQFLKYTGAGWTPAADNQLGVNDQTLTGTRTVEQGFYGLNWSASTNTTMGNVVMQSFNGRVVSTTDGYYPAFYLDNSSNTIGYTKVTSDAMEYASDGTKKTKIGPSGVSTQLSTEGAIGFHNRTSNLSSPVEGQMFYRSDTDRFVGVWGGSSRNFLNELDLSGALVFTTVNVTLSSNPNSYFILADATSGAIDVTTDNSMLAGRRYVVKGINNGANNVRLVASGSGVFYTNGSSSTSTTYTLTAGETIEIIRVSTDTFFIIQS